MMKKTISILLLFLLMNAFVSANAEEGTSYNLFKSKTYVKNPLELRDPFKRRINKKKASQGQSKTKNQLLGIYSNINNAIESKPIENIRIIGVVLGTERRAMAKIVGEGGTGENGEENIYYIKEGMKIGDNGAEVKAILPGGVVLVEKIRNVYDQDEYLETVIPISEE
jgi:Tfp pilus assembly protein PilP